MRINILDTMNLAYIYPHDAADPGIQSGRPHAILAGLQRNGAGVVPIFPLETKPVTAALPKKIGYRLIRRLHRLDRDPAYLAALAAEIEAQLDWHDIDALFSPGTEAIAHINSPQPLIYCADATFANLVDYYWDFTHLSREYLDQGHEQEREALARASLAIYPSQWAADSAIRDYGADPAKVLVLPFGANLGGDNSEQEVENWIEDRTGSEIRLLFVASHWERKGGDIVVAATEILNRLGHAVRLDVVGCEVPERHRELPWLHAHGRLSRHDSAQTATLTQLFIDSHFLFIPSRAEAYGLTFSEANAFGLPAISTATGGIPSVVRDGINGRMLPLDADATAYADAIVESFADPDAYRAMCRRAYREFAERTNWDTFCLRLIREAKRLAQQTPKLSIPAGVPITPSAS